MSDALSKEAQAGRKAKSKAKAKAKGTRKAKAEAPAVEAETTVDVTAVMADTIKSITDAATAEVDNISNANVHRWAKGLQLNAAEAVARELPKGTFEGRPLQFAVEQAANSLREAGREQVADTAFHPSEVSITRGAAKAWLGEDGLSSTFGKDNTPITAIAVNKAYTLRALPERDVIVDDVMEFAAESTEDAVAKFAKVVKLGDLRSGSGVRDLLKEVRSEAKKPNVTVADVLTKRVAALSPAKTSESITVSKDWFDGDWTELRAAATEIERFLGNVVNERTGLVTPTVLLERLVQGVVVREHGHEGLLSMYIQSGEMTEEQAEAFRRWDASTKSGEGFEVPADAPATDAVDSDTAEAAAEPSEATGEAVEPAELNDDELFGAE